MDGLPESASSDPAWVLQLQVRIPFIRPGRGRRRQATSGSNSTGISSNTSAVAADTAPGSKSSSQQQAQPRSGNQGQYLLSFLDDDMLIGRPQANGGSFIFERTSRDSSPWVWT